MKFLALTAVIALAAAQLESGEDCSEEGSECAAGLGCGEGVYEDDVIDGEVQASY